MAATVADQDPDDPVAFTKTYQEDLFRKTDKITFKGYKIEVSKKNAEGKVSEVKINKGGKVELLDLSQTKATLTREIEDKINEEYNIDKSKTYQIVVQGAKNGEVIEKKIQYQKVDAKLLRDFEDCDFITLKSAYRILNLSTIFSRIKESLSISGAFQTFGQIMDDIEDGCGVLGNECLNLSQSLHIFLLLNSMMASQNFYPLGNFIIFEETIIQQFRKHTLPVQSLNHTLESEESLTSKTSPSSVKIQGKPKKFKKKTSKSSSSKKSKKKSKK
tara:strand:+ start:642 stop:1463 length:822 start_codon:yes stop_codon:yes gene_type:complete